MLLQDYVMERLRRMEGVSVAAPDGAFYVLPDMSGFFGDGASADSFGPIPDADTLCRCRHSPTAASPVQRRCMRINWDFP
jgi:hypothetical protein